MNIKTKDMNKHLFILTAVLAISTLSLNAQIMRIYNGETLIKEYKSSEATRVVFVEESSDPQPGDKVEGTTTINGTTYTKAVGGTVADYVDLGITVDGKKVLWATHNLGASKPEEYGAYIAWGENGTEKEGYSAGVKTVSYNGWSNLKYCNGFYDSFTKYVATRYYGTVDNKTTLESQDDAATVNWGSDWRTPTDAELTALRTNCTWKWYEEGNADYNGVAGYKVAGTNGNSIFLPAAGYRSDSSLYNAGSRGYYWSSSLYSSDSENAYGLYFNSNSVYRGSDDRYRGRSLRPVRSE